jgi:hypothetical protein
MTADTRHHLTCSHIHNLFPNRVSEFPLGFMAPGANGIAIAPQHGKPV